MLNDDDLNRYARQVIIPNFDEDGQEKLLKTRCLIVGAGGLGCPVALYASAAGFGHIEIVDGDNIEASNLNRQIAHKNDHIGNNKAENLAQECLKINPSISIISTKKKFDETNNINNFDSEKSLISKVYKVFIGDRLYYVKLNSKIISNMIFVIFEYNKTKS